MNCLRCGVETENDQVFCDDCRQFMAKHPVKPGTPAPLHLRPAPDPEKKQARRKELKPEEILAQLRSLIRWLLGIIAVLTLVICVLCWILFHTMDTPADTNEIGRNYNTINTTQTE